jgi:hypothetical protein
MNKQTKHCFPAMIPKVVEPGNIVSESCFAKFEKTNLDPQAFCKDQLGNIRGNIEIINFGLPMALAQQTVVFLKC